MELVKKNCWVSSVNPSAFFPTQPAQPLPPICAHWGSGLSYSYSVVSTALASRTCSMGLRPVAFIVPTFLSQSQARPYSKSGAALASFIVRCSPCFLQSPVQQNLLPPESSVALVSFKARCSSRLLPVRIEACTAAVPGPQNWMQAQPFNLHQATKSAKMQAQPFAPPGNSKLQDKPTKADTSVMMDNVRKWIAAVRALFAPLLVVNCN
eukprot:scaffold77643_cov19-Tisochrysis_lutea.AAC.3